MWWPCRGAAAGAMPGQKSFRRRRDDEEEEEDEQLAEEVRWVGRRRGTRPGPAGNPTGPSGKPSRARSYGGREWGQDGTPGVL